MKESTQAKPSIGRIVHFYAAKRENPDGNPFAALITATRPNDADAAVDLVTFGPGSIYFHSGVRRGPDDDLAQETEAYWVWPPRVTP